MYDAEIRKSLKKFLKIQNRKFADTIIVDEFELCSGLARVDLAVINGVIHGYEIKGENDTLLRLPNQICYYNKSLEKITISVNPSHLKKTLEIVPEWWGVIIVEKDKRKKVVKEIRDAEINQEVDIKSMLQLLWKDELFNIMRRYNINIKTGLNKKGLRENIFYNLSKKNIISEIRQTLKSRKNWRS
ncbi:MAG: hypothetical protein B6D44_10210 [Ignavibacteriales bacterium UTCHB2]|jgi:hypothetical protein|nr:MAG: hypothetical protein B6D44_10210 [Ignavibacteriales bacterium UTCHB2]